MKPLQYRQKSLCARTSFYSPAGKIIYLVQHMISAVVLTYFYCVLMERNMPNMSKAMEAVVENSPLPIGLYVGREMRIALANKAILRTWDKDETILGKTFREVLPEIEGQGFFEILDDVYTSGIPYAAAEAQVYLKINGAMKLHYFNFDYQPIKDEDGNVWAVLNTATDVTELVLSKRESSDTKEKLAFALEAAHIGTWELDLQHQTVQWDDRTRSFYGYPEEGSSVPYEVVVGSIHEEDREMVRQRVQQALDPAVSGGQYEATFRVVSGKHQRWLQCKGRAYFDSHNQPFRFSGTAEDITGSIEAEKKLKVAEQAAKFAIDGAALGTFNVDLATGKMIYSPVLALMLTGEYNEHLTREVFIQHILEEDLPLRREAYDTAYRTGLLQYEARFRWKDGSIHWVQVKGGFLFDQDKPFSLAGITMDITAQKLAALALQEAETRFSAAFENASMGMVFIQEDGRFSKANKSFADMLHYAPEEMNRLNYLRIVHKDFEEESRVAFNRMLSGEYSFFNSLVKFNTKEGGIIWGQVNITRIADEHNRTQNIIAIVADISNEVAARKEQQKLLSIVEHSTDFIGIFDLENNLTYVNRAGVDLLDVHTTHGIKSTDLLAPGDMEKMERVLPVLMDNGHWSGRLHYQNLRTQEIIPFYTDVFRLDSPITSKPIALACVARDIRAELAAQQSLINSERRFRNMIEQAPVAMLVLKGKELVFEKVNKYMLDILARDESIIGRSLYEVLPEISEHPILQHLAGIYTSGKPYRGMEIPVTLNRHGQLEEGYYSVSFTPLLEDGKVTGILQVATDETLQVKARKAIQESEAFLRGITTASPAALWMSDNEGNITYVSQIWIDWTGQQAAAHMGTGWFKPIVQEDVASATEKFRCNFTGRKYHECQFRIRHTDGTERWIECTGNPQYNSRGEFTGYVGACVDISQQKELEKQKDDFLAVASHELKTPVTTIKAYTQVLEMMLRNEGDAVKADMLKKLDSQISRLTNLIGDLLDVTKIQTGKMQFNREWFDLDEMVADVAGDLQHTTRNHQLITRLDYGSKLYSDKERLGQVITNLVTNAIKYSPGENRIIISTSEKNGEVSICVQDFGIGISEDHRSRVFEQFYRVSGDTQLTYPGLGLGLYISAEIIRREGGRIWVESEVGKGSTFCVVLPKEKNPAEL
jgi:PAS domain S-box-containing protein